MPSDDATMMRQKLGITAYFYPGGPTLPLWAPLTDGSTPAGSMVVAAVFGGGVTTPTQDYVNIVKAAQDAGLVVLAYVDSRQPDRAEADIMADVDKAFDWYRVDGAFFDNALVDDASAYNPTQLALYSRLDGHAKTRRVPGRQVLTAINPGRVVPEAYVNAADVIVNAEMAAADYSATWQPWGWEGNYPPGKFWHILHDCGSGPEMASIVGESRRRNAGILFVTDSTDYTTFAPPYWPQEVEEVTG